MTGVQTCALPIYPVDTTKLKMKDLKLFEEEQVNPQNMEYLGRLIDFCRENDIQFVAVTTPIPINTLQAYSDNYNAAWKYFGQYFDEHEERCLFRLPRIWLSARSGH